MSFTGWFLGCCFFCVGLALCRVNVHSSTEYESHIMGISSGDSGFVLGKHLASLLYSLSQNFSYPAFYFVQFTISVCLHNRPKAGSISVSGTERNCGVMNRGHGYLAVQVDGRGSHKLLKWAESRNMAGSTETALACQ